MMNCLWAVRHWLRNRRDALCAWWQRLTIGYAYVEAWNLNDYLARYALPRVRHLRDHNTGFPADMTAEEWQEALEAIVWSLERYVGDAFGGAEDVLTLEEEADARYRRGLKLFGEHWLSLWD